MKKLFLVVLAFLINAAVIQNSVYAQLDSNQPIEHFSTKGVVIGTDPAKRVAYVKTEGGLELTFFVSDTTVITQGQEAKTLSDLAPEDEIDIEYDYNQDYEKIAHSIKKRAVS